MDYTIPIQDIRIECLKLAVYSGDESPDVCLALSERYVDYVLYGVKPAAKVVRIVANGPGDMG